MEPHTPYEIPTMEALFAYPSILDLNLLAAETGSKYLETLVGFHTKSKANSTHALAYPTREPLKVLSVPKT